MPKTTTITIEIKVEDLAESIAALSYEEILNLFERVDGEIGDCEFTRRAEALFNHLVGHDCNFEGEEQ